MAEQKQQNKIESLIDPNAYVGFRTIRISCPSDVVVASEWKEGENGASKQQQPTSMRLVTLMIQQNYDFGLGGGVWDSALVLVKYLTRAAAFPQGHFWGKRVLELGSGTGVCGLSLAFLGAKVTLTDVASHLPLIDDNISFNVNAANGTNHLRQNITVTDYSWGSEPGAAQVAETAAPSTVTGANPSDMTKEKKKKKKKKKKRIQQQQLARNLPSAHLESTSKPSAGPSSSSSSLAVAQADPSSAAISAEKPPAPTPAPASAPAPAARPQQHRPPLRAPYDVIIGSDLVYDNTQDYAKLCKSFFLLSNANTEIYLAYEKRTRKEIAFFQELANKFTFSKVPNTELDEEFQSDDIGVFKIRRK